MKRKPKTLWAIFCDGEMMTRNIRSTGALAKISLTDYATPEKPESLNWSWWEKKGYTVRKVKVTWE